MACFGLGVWSERVLMTLRNVVYPFKVVILVVSFFVLVIHLGACDHTKTEVGSCRIQSTRELDLSFSRFPEDADFDQCFYESRDFKLALLGKLRSSNLVLTGTVLVLHRFDIVNLR